MIVEIGKIGDPLPDFLIKKPPKTYPVNATISYDVMVVRDLKDNVLLCETCRKKNRTTLIRLSGGISWKICDDCHNSKRDCSVCKKFRIPKIGQGRTLKNEDYFICADCITQHGTCKCGEKGLFYKNKKVVCQNCYRD